MHLSHSTYKLGNVFFTYSICRIGSNRLQGIALLYISFALTKIKLQNARRFELFYFERSMKRVLDIFEIVGIYGVMCVQKIPFEKHDCPLLRMQWQTTCP